MSRSARLVVTIGVLLLSCAPVSARHPGHGKPNESHHQETITDRTPSRVSPVTGVPSWKTALHMHGSLSEGDATIRSHHEVAKLLGIDVIWWTDHDHMFVAEAHRATRFGFDTLTEPLNHGEPWTASSNGDIALIKSIDFFRNGLQTFSAAIDNQTVATGTGSFRMSGSRQFANRSDFSYLFNCEATRRRVSLAADATIRIKVFPEVISNDATGVITAILSRPLHPSIVSTQRLEIQYFLSNTITAPVRNDYIYRVPVPYTPGQWNEIVLNVSQDAVAGYPFINGLDNALTELLVGIESKNNAVATVCYDDLRIDYAATGAPLFAWQRTELDAYNALNEGVTHLQGVEHSYSPKHMLEYGPNTPIPDWNAYETLSPGFVNGWLVNWQLHQDFVGYRITQLAHQNGAAVSYAHMFGTGTPLLPTTLTKEALLAQLLGNHLYNSDLLEVGYRQRERPMPDHLWVWDQLALNSLYYTGLGVSDSHGADPAGVLTNPTFSMTQFIYADTAGESDLADALRAGRTYFADPVIYNGTMDIETDRGALMGQVVVTDRPSVRSTIHLTGLTPGDTARVIDSGNLAVAVPVATPEIDLTANTTVNQTTGSFVRAEVHSTVNGRTEKAYSNPVYYRSNVPQGGIGWRRAAFDVLGITSNSFDHFDLNALSWSLDGSTPVITIGGAHDTVAGTVTINVSAVPGSVIATFAGGLAGSVAHDGHTLTLSSLLGSGTVTIRVPPTCPADANADGTIDVDDLNIVLANWLRTVPFFTSGDVTGNGTVDVDDLNVVLSNWGLTCN